MATKRGYYREEIRRTIDNLEMGLTHLARLVDAYKDPHPELAEAFKQVGDALVLCAETLQKLHDTV